jgi:hypothetical protein
VGTREPRESAGALEKQGAGQPSAIRDGARRQGPPSRGWGVWRGCELEHNETARLSGWICTQRDRADKGEGTAARKKNRTKGAAGDKPEGEDDARGGEDKYPRRLKDLSRAGGSSSPSTSGA